jgi:hypothetical protein
MGVIVMPNSTLHAILFIPSGGGTVQKDVELRPSSGTSWSVPMPPSN